jgi:hypothetical protein
MNKQESPDYMSITGWNNGVGSVCRMICKGLMTVSRLCLIGALASAAVAVSAGDWGIKSAMAKPSLPLTLTVTGPRIATVGEPLDGINVQIINRGLAAPDSRLRLYIVDEDGRELQAADVKLYVLEGRAWKEAPVEAIDGAVMGAIGAEGKPHKERHKRGGFAIGDKANKNWPLRVTFRLPGRYSLAVAVSPDNGETHLAQPASLSLEAL